jgi:hypothetical protein
MAQTLLENQTKTLTVEWGQLKQRRGMYNKCQFSFFASFKKKGESFLHQTGSSKIFLFVNTRQVGIVLFLISGVLTHFKHELDMTERGVKLRDLGFIFSKWKLPQRLSNKYHQGNSPRGSLANQPVLLDAPSLSLVRQAYSLLS